MKNKLMVAALMGTTFLTPKPAEAAPVVGFIAGAIGVSASAAAAIGISAGFAAGATFGATLIGGVLVKTVVAVGLSKLAQKLQSRAAGGGQSSPSARMANFAQPISYAETCYGRFRKGGPLGFTGFKVARRFYVPILAAHEIEAFDELWLDERQVWLNSSTYQGDSNVTVGPIKGYGRINPFTGAPGQVADPGLSYNFPEITSAHDFKGLAGAAVWAKRPPDEDFTRIYPNGKQWTFSAVIRGKKDIYDPRDQTRKYTDNAALILADWFTDYLGGSVDWDEVAVEADASDEWLSNAQGENQKRWTLNGSISSEQEFEQQRAQLAVACDAFVYERTDGKIGFKVGRWIEPTLTLTADDFYSFELTEGRWGADSPDEVAAQYVEPDNKWRETPSGVWVENDVAIPKRDEPQLFMCTNHNQASRINKRLARTKRADFQLRGTMGLKGYELLGGGENGSAHRFFRVIHEEMGVDEVFEIGELARDGVGAFSLQANSVKKADFDFTAATEEPARPEFSDVQNDGSVPEPASVKVGAESASSLRVVWDGQDDAYTPEIRYRLSGTQNFTAVRGTAGFPSGLITGLASGSTYQLQVRNTKSGVGSSDWTPAITTSATVTVDPTVPAALLSLDAVGDVGGAEVTISAPDDPAYFGARLYRNTSNDFGTAQVIGTLFGPENTSATFADEGLTAGTYYYWAEPINASGSAGPLSGPNSTVVT